MIAQISKWKLDKMMQTCPFSWTEKSLDLVKQSFEQINTWKFDKMMQKCQFSWTEKSLKQSFVFQSGLFMNFPIKQFFF
jgi:hypothetical protein